MSRPVTLAVVVLVLWVLAPVRPASADGASCSDWTNTCKVEDQDRVADPSIPPSKKRPPSGDKPEYPPCSSFRGGSVIALPGTRLADLPADERPEPDWVRSSCQEMDGLRWVWSPPRVNAAAMARTLLVRLQLRPITIGLTPKRQGSMGFVGVPNWLWVQDPARTTYGPATIRAGGISLTARVELIEWDMGNGAVVRCRNRGTEWFDGMGVKPSPTCGYMYSKQGHYTVRATAHWVARWSGYGQSGTIPLSLTATRPLEIGELQVVITR